MLLVIFNQVFCDLFLIKELLNKASDSHFTYTLSFHKQHFYKEPQAEVGKKIKQILSNTLRLNFFCLKIIHIPHPRYHPKMIGYILKNKQKKKCTCFHEIIRLIIMKMEMKWKTDHIDTIQIVLGLDMDTNTIWWLSNT